MKKINVKNVIWKEGEYYVVQCLNVDVSSFGKTKKEALANIDEALENLADAIDVHLQTLKDIGQLDQFLKEKGVTPVVDDSRTKQGTSVTTDDASRDENSYVWSQLQSPGYGRGWNVNGDGGELSFELHEILTEQVVLV